MGLRGPSLLIYCTDSAALVYLIVIRQLLIDWVSQTAIRQIPTHTFSLRADCSVQ